jgi:hypothetical protein
MGLTVAPKSSKKFRPRAEERGWKHGYWRGLRGTEQESNCRPLVRTQARVITLGEHHLARCSGSSHSMGSSEKLEAVSP